MVSRAWGSCCLLTVAVTFLCCLVALPATAGDDLRLERENMRNILNVVSKDVEKNYYDESLQGLDWKALTAEARKKIDEAKSVSGMLTAIYVLVDKLHDSHTLFDPPGRVNRPLFGFIAKPFGEDILIYAINPKGAAAEAGLKVGDQIIQANGYTAERNTFNLMMYYYSLLSPAQHLELVYSRAGDSPHTLRLKSKLRKSTMVEDLTNVENLWSIIAELDNPEKYWATTFAGIGYMQVPSFSGHEELPMPHQFETVPKAMIVDLRGNHGGDLDTLSEFTGHFVNEPGTMGDIVTRRKSEPVKLKPKKPNFATIPLFVLVDSESASAAEMFARHLQLSVHAKVIGDHSSGKVVASRYFPEQIGTDRVIPFGIQISVGKVVFPNNEVLENTGVTPDVVCLPKSEDLARNADPCLEQAVSLARKAAGMQETVPEPSKRQIEEMLQSMLRESEKAWKN